MEAMLFNFENDYDTDQYYLYNRLEDEYWPYVARTPMTTKERRALRKWVRTGHSVYESPASQFLGESATPSPVLDTYRMDEDFRKETHGMTPERRRKYMEEVTGWANDDDEGQEFAEKPSASTGPEMRHREMYYLWEFIAAEGLQEEAREYLDDHMDHKSPFEY